MTRIITNSLKGEDNQFHLTGTTHILNTVSTFGSSGGLGEAAAWLCLRQDIYVSLTTQQPLRTNLQNFHNSDIFHRTDDFAWSSRMVYLLAKALQCAFSGSSESIGAEIEKWYLSKPHSFEPVRVVPRGSSVDGRLPVIWMLLPVHGECLAQEDLLSFSHLIILSSYHSLILSFSHLIILSSIP